MNEVFAITVRRVFLRSSSAECHDMRQQTSSSSKPEALSMSGHTRLVLQPDCGIYVLEASGHRY
jgi:hypothetical protein